VTARNRPATQGLDNANKFDPDVLQITIGELRKAAGLK
jgi:hypothetical protein